MQKRFKNTETGLTLIDMAILLTVIGIMAVPLLQTYRIYKERKYMNDTVANISAIQQAISNYYLQNGFYPCPSTYQLANNNPLYGTETRGGGPGTACTLPATAGVIQGGVPFVQLLIPERKTWDGAGNRIRYAVSQDQTVAATFNVTGGDITLRFRGVDLPTPTAPPGASSYSVGAATISIPLTSVRTVANMHYILISHGLNGVGAVSNQGAVLANCNTVAGTRDQENCNDDNVFFSAGNISNSDVLGQPLFLDDFTLATDTLPPLNWYSFAGNNIFSTAMTVAVNFRPGTPGDPAISTGRGADVRGNVRVEGQVRAAGFCTENETLAGRSCFNATQFAGNDVVNMSTTQITSPCNGVGIPGGQGITGITRLTGGGGSQAGSNVRVRCSGLFLMQANQSCPSADSMIDTGDSVTNFTGPRLRGIRAGGGLICGG